MGELFYEIKHSGDDTINWPWEQGLGEEGAPGQISGAHNGLKQIFGGEVKRG